MDLSFALPAGITSFLFAVAWMYVWRRWDDRDPEPFWAMYFAAFLGIVSALAVLFFESTSVFELIESNIYNGMLLILFFVIIEEVVKFLAFLGGIWVYRKHINQMVDGLAYGAATALGFAFVENILYFMWYEMDIPIVIFRSIETMFAHTLFTGIACFYFVIAFNPMQIQDKKLPITKKQKITFRRVILDLFKAFKFHITTHHVLPHKQSKHKHRRTEVIFEGFYIAIILHFLHNIFAKYQIFGQNLAFLMAILIIFAAWFCFSRFSSPWYAKIAKKKRARIGNKG